jgi:hypothetical protein
MEFLLRLHHQIAQVHRADQLWSMLAECAAEMGLHVRAALAMTAAHTLMGQQTLKLPSISLSTMQIMGALLVIAVDPKIRVSIIRFGMRVMGMPRGEWT